MNDNEAKTPEDRFTSLVEEFLGDPDITLPSHGRAFGSAGLKVRQKIFAMPRGDKLVVKLPRARVNALVASGTGEYYDPRHNGQIMKEWVVIGPTSKDEWIHLAREAMEFVNLKKSD